MFLLQQSKDRFNQSHKLNAFSSHVEGLRFLRCEAWKVNIDKEITWSAYKPWKGS